MKLTFSPGGIHIPENKLTASQPIVEVDLPRKVVLPLVQSIGTPPKAIVARGEKVTRFQKIAEPQGKISAALHAPVSGTIKSVGRIDIGNGCVAEAIVIEANETDHETDIRHTAPKQKEITSVLQSIATNQREFLGKVADAGIVGLGGATFPTAAKLDVAPGQVDTLIINGAECEPYLTCDHALMLAEPQNIVNGTRLAMALCNASRAIIGIEDNKPDAIAAVDRAITTPGISIGTLKTKYPQGGEKQLIYALTHRRVPDGAIPAAVGCVVLNVATVSAVAKALLYDIPLVDRVLTISGPTLPDPANFRVCIGYPADELMHICGISHIEAGKVIEGGPMMGKTLNSIDIPVRKGSSGYVIFPPSESYRHNVEPCIRCARCVDACPMGLEPYLLSTTCRLGLVDEAAALALDTCIQCGCCSYVCPSARPLLDYIRIGKLHLRKKQIAEP